MRFFNTEGPNVAEDHYCLPPLERWDLEDILTLIDQKKYFLLHAPRQTGKTTCLLALADYLNREGRYRAVYANIEAAQAARERVEVGMAAVVQTIANGARWSLQDENAQTLARQVLQEQAALVALDGYLAGLGLDWGWLVIFDRRSGQPPIRERTSSEQKQSPQGRRMTVVRA